MVDIVTIVLKIIISNSIQYQNYEVDVAIGLRNDGGVEALWLDDLQEGGVDLLEVGFNARQLHAKVGTWPATFDGSRFHKFSTSLSRKKIVFYQIIRYSVRRYRTRNAILTINVLLILQLRDTFFFWREKHIMGPLEGFLRSSRLFWPLKMVPSVARCHFGAPWDKHLLCFAGTYKI